MKETDEAQEATGEGEPAAAHVSKSEELLQWEEGRDRQDRRLLIARITVLVCGLGIIICVILMCVKGVGGLVTTMDGAIDGLEQAEELSNTAIALVDNFTAGQEDAKQAFIAFEESWDEACPSAEAVLDEVFDTEVENETAAVIEKVLNFINETQESLYEEAADLRKDLVKFSDTFQDMQEKAKSYNWAFYVAGK
jgi:hypothetical protein